ncbi:MAG: cobalt-precorrin-5B (C(1))-methyltransferase CbiD [Lachnospiraceae bacterium]|jgi:cobalt-precorrin-5B (C1)-methyltransferase
MRDAGQGYIQSGQKSLRCGYTTGSCAAGAAKAAAWMLISQRVCGEAVISTPSGKTLTLSVEKPVFSETQASCAVRKDGGDDVDATDGLLIFAKAEALGPAGEVSICGGEGVGVVTKPGLDRPVGDAAINTVPRQMIEKEVREVLERKNAPHGVKITIEVPGGREIAAKTFNPRLGIVGGISILGTSGIVEPMSEKALLDTIRAQLSQRRAMGEKTLIITPGNMGQEFLSGRYGISKERIVLCSNFIGDTLDAAVSDGFESVVLAGHIGKLVKLGSGIMNTHSHVADGRMETFAACGVEAGIPTEQLQKVLTCTTAEEAVGLMMREGIWGAVLDRLLARIDQKLKERVQEKMKTGAVLFSSKCGYLGETDGAGRLLQD